MVSRMIYKNALKKIKKAFGRYISLFIIVMVGVGFLAGIQASAPDIAADSDSYFKTDNLMDFKIVSTMGLTDDDVTMLQTLKGVKSVIPSYSLDVMSHDKAIRIHAIEESVNNSKLIDGRMPKTNDECLADSKTYKVGDTVAITSDVTDKLNTTVFTVVGTIDSVLYLSKNYGSTTVGDGKLSSFVFIEKDNFTMDAYSEIYLVADKGSNLSTFSENYKTIATQLNNALVRIKPEREIARYNEIYQKANDEIAENEAKLNDEKVKAHKKLKDGKAMLDAGMKQLQDGKIQLAKNEAALLENERQQNAVFADARKQIADGWLQVNAALEQAGIKQTELDGKIEELSAALEQMKAQLSSLPIQSAEYEQLSAQVAQYTASYEGLVRLKESIATLTAQEEQLNQGIETFSVEMAKAKAEIQQGKEELAENEAKLKDGYRTYNKNLAKFNAEMKDAEAKIADAKNDLSEMDHPKWHIFDRDAAVGYTNLDAIINVITSFSAVIPLFFIVIVILMTSNSMARMIAEERGELGTLTSLGYKDNRIIGTYLLYVLSASGLGALIGILVGCKIIPPLIYANLRFILPPLIIRYNLWTCAVIMLVTLTLMTLVTVYACNCELRQVPAMLMRPVPPKHGQRIFLERIGLLWKRLSFTWKVTMRNMFRYKKRALMTIVGVAGCTSLLLACFGLRDSMNGVAQKQYGDIFRYQNMIILKDEAKAIGEDLQSVLLENQAENPLLLRQSAMKCESSGRSMDVFLIVPENESLFKNYFHLASTNDQSAIFLNDTGVIVTRKIADLTKAKKRDRITVTDADNNNFDVTVAGIAQNYTSNYIYMSSTVYQEIFNKSAEYNTAVSNHIGDEKVFAKNMIDSGLAVNVVLTSDVIHEAIEQNENFNSIIVLVLVVASLLTIIVLYILTSISISERLREIATLKVLGFRDQETNSFIYREAIILTLISIGIGLGLGVILHRVVLNVIESAAIEYFRNISWLSFVLSGAITMMFSLIMQGVTSLKLKTIDMIESLKSVE